MAVVALAAWSGCADAPKSPAVVRVGDLQISRATVDRWSRAIERGAAPESVHGGLHGTPKEQALAFLISTDWLRGEAAALGVAPSEGAVQRGLEQRREANGAAEFEKGLRALGQTTDDIVLEIEAELAAAAIRRKVLSGTPAVTEAEIADYYRSHRRLFLNVEQRTADLVEDLPSPAAATALVSRIGIGPRFSKKALHEELQVEPGVRLLPDIESVTRAIFAARPGVASRPMSLNGHWTVFVVRKITPASYKSLGDVHATIAARLAALHRGTTLSAFTDAYRARWTAKTSCRSGYVVQGCAQYAGPTRPQPDPFPGE